MPTLTIHKLPKTGLTLFFLHIDAYLIGLTIHKLPKAGLIPFFSHIGAYLIGLTIHKLPKVGLILFHFFYFPLGLNFNCQFFQIFILSFLSGLTLNCQFFKFLFLLIWTYPRLPVLSNFYFFHLDLSLIANSSNFHFFIWTYLWLPILRIFIFYPDLPSSASLIMLWPNHSYLPNWTYTSDARLVDILWEIVICLNYHLPSEGLSEAFIGCKALFRFASLFQIRK